MLLEFHKNLFVSNFEMLNNKNKTPGRKISLEQNPAEGISLCHMTIKIK